MSPLGWGAALLLAISALPTSAAAHPQTRPGAARIVVRAPAARVTVDRDPFRLSFSTGTGRPMLSELAGRSGGSPVGPLPTPLTPDPLAPGFDNPATPTLYAPLSFLVGSEALQQYDGGLFGGNLESGQRSGVQYAATRVLGARRSGGGSVRLRLATSDPSGRTLSLRLAPAGCCAISVRADAHPAAGVATLGDSFVSGPGEGYFGFGGRHIGLDQRGKAFSSFVNEENVDGLTGWGIGGDGTSLYPNGPPAAYYPQAEFVSSRGYGFLLDQPQLARFKLAVDGPRRWNVAASARGLRYVVAPGSPRRAIATLTSLSGRQPLPPRWALGPMMDRLVKNFGETQADYEGNLLADLRDLRRHRIPIRAYRIEGWGFPGGNHGLALHTFVAPEVQARVIRTLRSRNIHPIAYLRPWVEPDSAAVERGWVATHADGTPYLTSSTTGRPIALIDFTDPAAVRYWKRQVRAVFGLGFDGFMQDFGEEVLFGMRFHDGETGRTMHNRYLILFHRATREVIESYERSHPNRRLWFFTRAGYSGHPGSTAYEGGNFAGDGTTDWSRSSGLASSTPDMLNRAVGGAYGYGTDIGGYFDLTTPPTTKELFIRWAEWAALSPIFRLHGAGPTGTHAPWTFDAQTVRIYRRLSRLHLRAAPLILRLWRAAGRTGIPPTRPLWLSDPADRRARRADQEWLLGPDLLVAPVVEQGATSRRVYLPAGCWRDPDGRRYAGRGNATVAAPLATLPYFRRCGTDPLGPA
ncbi:MAG: glycoside hydrolase family 31 protein [Solirubrobacterales bacterium]